MHQPLRSTESRIRSLPCWAGPIDIAPLKGGLSNESFLVKDAAGKHVVRFGEDFPCHHVIRDRELLVAHAAHAAGFAPRVEYAAHGVMVSAFIEARTYDATDMRENIGRVTDLARQFHTSMPHFVSGPGYIFWVFHVIRDYARTLVEGKSRMASEAAAFAAISEELEQAQTPLPIVFGHHDMLAANFLDDGKRLWLIDFEYAAYGTAMFDIANIAAMAQFSKDEADDLGMRYFGSAAFPALQRAFSAMQCASLLREATWSLVSELHLNAPGVDYATYSDENLARFWIALDRHHSAFGKSRQ